MLLAALAVLVPAAQIVRPPQPPARPGSTAPIATGSAVAGESVRIERGDGEVPVSIPRDEELVFDVLIDLGILGDVDVGDVTLSSGTERTLRGLPSARDSGDRHVEMLDRTWVRSVAEGGYAGYHVTHTITASHLAQDWPRILYEDKQRGSEARERRLRLGLKDGVPTAEYRNDHHCSGCKDRAHFVDSVWAWGDPSHCDKCKRPEHRVWKKAVSREVPAAAVDMLTAVYVARAMVELGVRTTSVPLIDKQRVWRVTITQGSRQRQTVPVGTFECTQMQLDTKLESAPPGEETAGSKFQGLFGLQGTIRIWFDAASGVPVLIEGQLPIPVPLVGDLDLSILLKKHRGTPATFRVQK